jgi:endonuclease III-like uncharacterized protein
MTIENKVRLLINYIKSLSDFKIIEPDTPYRHMGATVTDAMLQAGTTWETVVSPRVQELRHSYPEAKTTTGFLKLLERIGPGELLKWNDREKPNRVLRIARFFAEEGIETEADLKTWLENEANIVRLKELRGIGNKTADYFKILCDIPTSAVDRHLIEFLNGAGIEIDRISYSEAREIINKSAEQMGINKSVLDHSIWKYMSSGGGIKPCT